MKKIDLVELMARERAGMPDDWRAFRYSWMPPGGKPLYLEVVGAVAPIYTRGDRKGTPNFKRRDVSTERTVYLTPAEMDAWEKRWEHQTGACRHCAGSGERLVSWSRDSGTKTRPCEDCGGSGIAAGCLEPIAP